MNSNPGRYVLRRLQSDTQAILFSFGNKNKNKNLFKASFKLIQFGLFLSEANNIGRGSAD